MSSATPRPLLNMLPFGVILLNRKGKILFANSAAEQLLSGGELARDDGFLKARSATHNRALSDALDRLIGDGPAEPVGFSIARSHKRPISVVIAQIPRQRPGPVLARQAVVSVFLSDPETAHSISIPLLRDLFDFTPVESSIATLMMHCMDTAAIASRLGITRNTLRDHLKSMFSKTHTHTQADLLQTLLRSPVALIFCHRDHFKNSV